MKKILTTLLAGCLLLTLLSCKSNDNKIDDKTSEPFFVEEIKYTKIAEYEYALSTNISKTSDFSVANVYKECSVTRIKSSASINNTHIKSLKLGSNMNYVEDYAFKGCTNLVDVEMYPNVCFGEGVFESCNNIKALEENNLLYLEAKETEEEQKNEYYYLFRTQSNSKNIVTSLKTVSILDAFRNNNDIENITLNSGVKYINSSAFKNSSLKSINISSSVVYIGRNAFSGTSNLNITLESDIKGYFTLDGELKEEVTLTSDNVVNYLTGTYQNYFFYKEA